MDGKGLITVAIAEQEKEFLIDVTDTGKGIAAKNVAKVFKPGFTTKKRGWGLGLSLSKRIIEQYHKGTAVRPAFRTGCGNHVPDRAEEIGPPPGRRRRNKSFLPLKIRRESPIFAPTSKFRKWMRGWRNW